MKYKVIKSNVENKIEIKKSLFITHLIYVQSKEEALEKLNYFSKQDATHNCYAYIIEENGSIYSKFSDDNEPQGTAGLPMLEALKMNNLVNVLALTIRYYGGIKLGSSGLVKAYRNSVKEALKETEILFLKKGLIIEISCSFSEYNKIINTIDKDSILKTNFENEVIFVIKVLEENLNTIINKIEKLLKREVKYKELSKILIKSK